MTTRSGRAYKLSEMSTDAGGTVAGELGAGSAETSAEVGDLVRLLLEDRRVREEELARET